MRSSPDALPHPDTCCRLPHPASDALFCASERVLQQQLAQTVVHMPLGCTFFSHARAIQSVLSPHISFLCRRRTAAHVCLHHFYGWSKVSYYVGLAPVTVSLAPDM
jgi:hypothetical protein